MDEKLINKLLSIDKLESDLINMYMGAVNECGDILNNNSDYFEHQIKLLKRYNKRTMLLCTTACVGVYMASRLTLRKIKKLQDRLSEQNLRIEKIEERYKDTIKGE